LSYGCICILYLLSELNEPTELYEPAFWEE